MALVTRFELATPTLKVWYSSTELHEYIYMSQLYWLIILERGSGFSNGAAKPLIKSFLFNTISVTQDTPRGG